jgi:hypothetical protein
MWTMHCAPRRCVTKGPTGCSRDVCSDTLVDVAQRYTYWHHTLQRESTPAQTTRQTYSVVTTVESEIVCERERDVLRCEDDTIPCATPSFKNVFFRSAISERSSTILCASRTDTRTEVTEHGLLSFQSNAFYLLSLPLKARLSYKSLSSSIF